MIIMCQYVCCILIQFCFQEIHCAYLLTLRTVESSVAGQSDLCQPLVDQSSQHITRVTITLANSFYHRWNRYAFLLLVGSRAESNGIDIGVPRHHTVSVSDFQVIPGF